MTENKRGTGINRWVIVAFIAAAVILPGRFAPIKPHVQLPGEKLTESWFSFAGQEFYLTNSMLTTWIVYLILFLLAFLVTRSLGDARTPSRGMAAVMETIMEALYNLVESTAGSKFARRIFPWVATIILLVITANFFKLLPGVETIGILHEAHEGGYSVQELIPGAVVTITESESETAAAEHSEGEAAHLYELVPFFRGPSTDLNFTAALALTTMIMVQVFGVMSNGLGYFTKFFNFGPFLKIWTTKNLNAFDVILPFIDIFVGVLELVAEFAKIISFSFRLLGALFGGAILLGVIGTLLPAALFGVLFLEMFIGAVQALVFGILALVFMSIATQSHGHGGEHEEAH